MDTNIQTPADAPPAPRILPFSKWIPLVAGVLAGIVLRLVFSGLPGKAYSPMMETFIVLAPLLVGAVTVYVSEWQKRQTWKYYVGASFIATQLFVLGTLLIMIEGLICAVIIAPLFGLMGVMGGLLMGAICRWTSWPKHAVYSLAAIPLILGGFEQRLPLPERINVVEHSRFISASPEQVWRHLMDAKDIAPQEVADAWMYRIGVPLPQAGVTEHRDEGLVRHVTMGKGIHFDQIATQWETGRYVRWKYRFAPDSIPAQALDDHVKIGGHYFDLIDTEYELRPNGTGTDLRISMHYRLSTRFNWYAQPVAEFLIGNFEQVILDFYAMRAETGVL